ncbi:gluconate 2-dehydrogenase subunit 3 family protein [Jatrophihabitans lederbergiae]|uniref:Gluconate 2-dehydrogenase subunit 3 family protein n=1 Tax=Jatrophihabitans lederbergiae TaxID=3075547 RepID=A0ABU2JC61_9ACTN|nr:gluconate 2-dehydrogenase subunit 3 family protein [Jatrophihabitans sp. DSM 44399]MDT0262577.1 gluconate 2-dehydrogenase subunit 3 family protein [Jatrophihabitans sp. DSM 44399]
MSSQANWSVVTVADDSGRSADSTLFFDRDQWVVVEAATARIIPTDHDPGAREAGAVRFIDRSLAVYADGTGFLKLEGKEALAWQTRIAALRRTYVEGIRRLQDVSTATFGRGFVELEPDQQDQVRSARTPRSCATSST